MKITWLGHSSFLIKTKDVSIAFDPYYDNSVPGLSYPKNIEANYIFISHDHQDHSARINIKEIPTNYKLEYKFIKIPHDDVGGMKRGMNDVPIIKIDNLRIAHLGDIGDIKDIENNMDLHNIDIMFCPINGYFTIGAKEGKKIIDILRPKIFIPMHYEMKEKGIGYPDGGQINLFKELVKDYQEIDNYEIDIEDIDKNKGVIIFNKIYQ